MHVPQPTTGHPRSPAAVGRLVAIGWTMAIVASLAWNVIQERAESREDALQRARAAVYRDLSYFESEVPEIDLETGSAASVRRATRALLRLKERFGGSAHVVSAPALPGTTPADAWERQGLESIRAGAEEFGAVAPLAGEDQYRLMIPLLRVPADRDRPGRLIAVTDGVPMAEVEAVAGASVMSLAVAHGILWILGLSGVWISVGRLRMGIEEREREAQRRQELELKILQLERFEDFGCFAGGVAHDFNNVLTTILGSASLIQSQLDPESPLRHSSSLIVTAARRAAHLTSQMLACSGKGRVAVRSTNLTGLIRDMGSLLAAMASKKAQLRYELAADLPPIDADQRQIRQLVIDLLTNASEALHDDAGEIVVATYLHEYTARELAATAVDDGLPAGPYVVFEVRDSGCGMSDEVRARIFTPYFSTKFTGRGLGLAAALGIARGHGGAVEIHSTPGQGTTVRVILPPGQLEAEAEPSMATPEESTPPPRPAEVRVLVVDDEPEVREIAAAILTKSGFSVLSASDGMDALTTFRKDPQAVDCVLLDVTMPRMDGFETYRELRSLRPDLPVIFSSGYTDRVIRRIAEEAVGSGYLHKPWEPELLVTAVRKAVRAGSGDGQRHRP